MGIRSRYHDLGHLSEKQNFLLCQKKLVKCQDNADCFFVIEIIVHYKFVPHGQTVNQVFYKDVLIRLGEKIRKKHPEKWRTRTWFLHNDNEPAHSAPSISAFLAVKKYLLSCTLPIFLVWSRVTFFFPKTKICTRRPAISRCRRN